MVFLALILAFTAGAVLTLAAGGRGGSGDGEDGGRLAAGMTREPAIKPPPERRIGLAGEIKPPPEPKPQPELSPEPPAKQESGEEALAEVVGDEVINHFAAETIGEALGIDPTGIATGLSLVSLFCAEPPAHRVLRRRKPGPSPMPRRRKPQPGFSRDFEPRG